MLHRFLPVCFVLALFAGLPTMAQAQDQTVAADGAALADVSEEAAASSCPTGSIDTLIHVKMLMPEPIIDHTKSRLELRDFDVSTKSPYGKKNFTHVNGLMRGPVELKTNMTIAWQSNNIKGENCFWYRTITLTLKLKPTIYVASEIPENNCYYNAIIEHEMKHVEVDRGLIRDYQNIIYDNVENFVYSHGPVDHIPLGDEKSAQKQLTKALEKQVQEIHARMRKDRIDRQAGIDTLGEYNRVAGQCDSADMI